MNTPQPTTSPRQQSPPPSRRVQRPPLERPRQRRTVNQQQQGGLETRHVSGPRYVFVLFHLFYSTNVYTPFSSHQHPFWAHRTRLHPQPQPDPESSPPTTTAQETLTHLLGHRYVSTYIPLKLCSPSLRVRGLTSSQHVYTPPTTRLQIFAPQLRMPEAQVHVTTRSSCCSQVATRFRRRQ